MKKLAPMLMVDSVQQLVDQLYWVLKAVLVREGVSTLQWAFMSRALHRRNGVEFRQVMQATGETKDNVRRAAADLKGFADVVVNPKDRRARKLVLTKRGRQRTRIVFMRFEQELLRMLGAKEQFSQRAQQFKDLLWEASAYLAPADMTNREAHRRSVENRELISDDSAQLVGGQSQSFWTAEELSDDELL